MKPNYKIAEAGVLSVFLLAVAPVPDAQADPRGRGAAFVVGAAVGSAHGSSEAASASAAASSSQQQAAASQQQAATAQQQATAAQQQAAVAQAQLAAEKEKSAKAEQEAAAAKQQAAPAPGPAGSPLPLGTVVATLPAGCTATPVGGVNYYYCGGNFYQAVFEGSSLRYVTTKPK